MIDIEPSVDEENKIDEMAEGLWRQIQEETETFLKKQLGILGVEFEDVEEVEGLRKIIFPDDPRALAMYFYEGNPILGLRISDNRMCIEFDVPELTETQEKGEVQCHTTER